MTGLNKYLVELKRRYPTVEDLRNFLIFENEDMINKKSTHYSSIMGLLKSKETTKEYIKICLNYAHLNGDSTNTKFYWEDVEEVMQYEDKLPHISRAVYSISLNYTIHNDKHRESGSYSFGLYQIALRHPFTGPEGTIEIISERFQNGSSNENKIEMIKEIMRKHGTFTDEVELLMEILK